MPDPNKRHVNLPEHQLPLTPLTRDRLRVDRGGAAYDFDSEVRDIDSEFQRGFAFVKSLPRSVTVYGSARVKEGDTHYELARSVSRTLVERFGYAIVTGGGPGIMEAANRGALEAGGKSYGITIELPNEQAVNPYVTASQQFYFFFSRRFILQLSAEAYLFFPGGYGTLDEFFEIITLVQTRKIQRVPVILIGSDYWKPITDLLRSDLLQKHHSISPPDLEIFHICDHPDQVAELVGKAESRK